MPIDSSRSAAGGCPVGAGRRSFMGRALGAGAAGVALTGGGFAAGTLATGRASADELKDGRLPAVAFHGAHQAGITTPQPAAAMFVSFDVIAQNREELDRPASRRSPSGPAS